MNLYTAPKNALTEAERKAEWSRIVGAEIRRRVGLAAHLEGKPHAQAIVKGMCAHPRLGLQTFVRDWCWTYDPRNEGDVPKDLPFVLWPKQAEFLDWWLGLSSQGLCEKSRDNGITWLAVYGLLWKFLFVDGYAGAVGNRKEDLIDRSGDTGTIFFKIDYALRMLPPWMQPAGWNRNAHRAHMRISNPENRATITGEAGDNAGQGGRNEDYVLDEFHLMPHDTSVRAGVSKNARRILYIFTGADEDTEATRMVRGGAVPRFTITWKDDPRVGQDYYDAYRKSYGDFITARQLDVVHGDSGDDKFIPLAWLRRCVGITLPPGSLKTAGQDVGGAEAESVYAERDGGTLKPLVAWREPDPSVTAMRAKALGEAGGITALFFDAIGIGAGVGGTIKRAGGTFACQPIEVGVPASNRTYPDDDHRRSAHKRCANLKAEIWLSFRLRVQLTLRWLDGQAPDANPDAMVSLPDDPALLTQLSQVKQRLSDDGRIAAESKKDLAKRGVASPDRADAVVLAFGFDWLVASLTRQSHATAATVPSGAGWSQGGYGGVENIT